MHVRVQRPIAAPADHAWARLSDLGALAEWFPSIKESPADPLRVGAVRKAVLRRPSYGKDVLVERVTEVGRRRFTYEIEGGIGPLSPIVTTWEIASDDSTTTLTVESVLGVKGALRVLSPMVRMAWRKQLAAMADAFAGHVEATAQ